MRAVRGDSRPKMEELDVSRPNVARMYDYALGGKDNFPLDREAACEIVRAAPDAFQCARENRGFLRRAVGYVARQGVTQFIDIGAGLPTDENTHDMVRAVNERSVIAYVDYDPVVISHARAVLASAPDVIAVPGDLREPRSILENPALLKFFDLMRPAAVVLTAILHYIGPEACKVVEYIKESIPRGSYLIISHATADQAGADEIQAVRSVYDRTSAPITPRTAAEVGSFFDGLELAAPGITGIAAWRGPPGAERERILCYGGVARKI